MRKTFNFFLSLIVVLVPFTAMSQWEQTSAPIGDIYALRQSGLDIFAGTFTGVYRSTDNGDTWKSMNSGLPNAYICDLVVIDSMLYAATYSSGLYRSTDNGFNWVNQNFPYQFINVLARRDTTLFVGTDLGGVYRTSDKGNSWINLGLTDLSIRCMGIKDTLMFVGTAMHGLYRSTDAGTQWTQVNSGLSVLFVNTLMFYGDTIFVSDDGIYSSTTNGDNWKYIALSQNTIMSLAADRSKLFAGAWGGNSLFLSTDCGATWVLDDNDFPIYICRALFVRNEYLFAGTDVGIWRKRTSEFPTSSRESDVSVPAQFRLNQNYPNPFNPSTNISFTLPTRKFVSLKVFDVVGGEVGTLISQMLNAGLHMRQWNAIGLPSGVYFYRLQVGTFTETKKLILLR